MGVKDIKTKTLVSGDKALRITLDVLNPADNEELSALLTPKVEVWVDFLE